MVAMATELGDEATQAMVPAGAAKPRLAPCKAVLFHLAFYFVFIAAELVHKIPSDAYKLQAGVQEVLTLGGAPSAADAAGSRGASALAAVRSLDDALTWLEETFVPVMWAEGEVGWVLGVNRAIGGARLQRWQRDSQGCPGPSRLAAAYGQSLEEHANQTCFSSRSSFGEGSSGGTHMASGYWLESSWERDDVLLRVQALREEAWLTAATQQLRLQSVLYSGQVPLVVLVEANFLVDRAGATTASSRVRALPTGVYQTEPEIQVAMVVTDLLFVVFLCCLLFVEATSAVEKMDELCTHLRQFATILNWLVVAGGVGFVVYFVFHAAALRDLSALVADVMEAEGAGAGTSEEQLSRVDACYDEVDRLSSQRQWYELAMFLYMAAILLMFFNSLKGNPRLSAIAGTMQAVAGDLAHFLVVSLLVFSGFFVSAHVLFGQHLREWSTLALAASSSLQVFTANLDIARLEEIAPIAAFVWFWSYVATMLLISVNLLFTIVVDACAHARLQAADGSTLLTLLWNDVCSTHTWCMTACLKRRSASKVYSLAEAHQERMRILAKVNNGVGRRGSQVTCKPEAPIIAVDSSEALRLEVMRLKDVVQSMQQDMKELLPLKDDVPSLLTSLRSLEAACAGAGWDRVSRRGAAHVAGRPHGSKSRCGGPPAGAAAVPGAGPSGQLDNNPLAASDASELEPSSADEQRHQLEWRQHWEVALSGPAEVRKGRGSEGSAGAASPEAADDEAGQVPSSASSAHPASCTSVRMMQSGLTSGPIRRRSAEPPPEKLAGAAAAVQSTVEVEAPHMETAGMVAWRWVDVEKGKGSPPSRGGASEQSTADNSGAEQPLGSPQRRSTEQDGSLLAPGALPFGASRPQTASGVRDGPPQNMLAVPGGMVLKSGARRVQSAGPRRSRDPAPMTPPL